jgi:hypothetical protein
MQKRKKNGQIPLVDMCVYIMCDNACREKRRTVFVSLSLSLSLSSLQKSKRSIHIYACFMRISMRAFFLRTYIYDKQTYI